VNVELGLGNYVLHWVTPLGHLIARTHQLHMNPYELQALDFLPA